MSSSAADDPAPRLLRGLPSRNAGAFGRIDAKRSPGADGAGAGGAPPAYVALHARADPPPHRVVKTEKKNILLRQFEAIAEAKRERQKRTRALEAAGEERAEQQRARKAPRRAAASDGQG